MPLVQWGIVLGVLALTWLEPNIRGLAMATVASHGIIAVCCGLGAAGLTRLQSGPARWTGLIVLLLSGCTVAVGSDYLKGDVHEWGEWISTVLYGFARVLIPVSVAAWVSTRRAGGSTTAIQVTTIAFATAPIWAFISLLLGLLILHEGP